MNTEEIVRYVQSRNQTRSRFAPIRSQAEIDLEEALVALTKAAKTSARVFYSCAVVVLLCTVLFGAATYSSL